MKILLLLLAVVIIEHGLGPNEHSLIVKCNGFPVIQPWAPPGNGWVPKK